MKRALVALVLVLMFVFGAATATYAADVGTTPTPSPTPTVMPTPAPDILTINNKYTDGDMLSSYQDGYTPMIRDGKAVIVLPLNVKLSELAPGTTQLVTTIDLGTNGDPFVISNYDRDVPISGDRCIVKYEIPLTWPRTNGSFPVTISASYTSSTGLPEVQNFPLFVNITDGPGPTPEPTITPMPEPAPSQPVSQPKVIMSKYTVTPDPCYAGDVFTVNVTLTNTSEKTSVQNMTATYKSETTDLIPQDGAGTTYITGIDAGGTASFSFSMEVRADAEPKPQKINLNLSYEDSKTTQYTYEDQITVQVRQQIRLEFDPPKFSPSVAEGESIQGTLNLYNKGKNTLYNVTVAMQIPGIAPESTAFLGNMESGASKTADIYAAVGPSAEDPEAAVVYGPVEGKYLVTYEDEYGAEYELEVPVETSIMEMQPMDPGMVDPGMMEEPEPQGFVMPWWGWVAIAGGAAIIVGVVVSVAKKKKREKQLLEDMEDDELS